MPRSMRSYLLGLLLAAAGLWALLAHLAVGADRASLPVVALLLGGLSVLAYQFPVQVGEDQKVHVASSPLLAGAFLLSAPEAMLLAGAAALAGNSLLRLPILPRRVQRRPWWNWLLNAALTALAIGLASAAYHLIAGPTGAFSPATLRAGLAIVAAAALAFGVNTLGVALAVALRRQRRVVHVWRGLCRESWREEIGLALLAIVTALIADDYAWAILLQAGSIAVVQLSFRQSAQMRTQTKQTIEHLAEWVDRRDPYTYQHSQNVSRYATRLAERLGLPPDQIELIRSAALVHDIGKIGVRDAVLLKPGRLTDAEFAEMRRHPEIGAETVAHLPEYRDGLRLILHHHEAWDGSGYPDGLKGPDTPLGARILAVADSYDAMATDRPYRQALPIDVIMAQLRGGSGRQWDPQLVALWLEELEPLAAAAASEAGTPKLAVQPA